MLPDADKCCADMAFTSTSLALTGLLPQQTGKKSLEKMSPDRAGRQVFPSGTKLCQGWRLPVRNLIAGGAVIYNGGFTLTRRSALGLVASAVRRLQHASSSICHTLTCCTYHVFLSHPFSVHVQTHHLTSQGAATRSLHSWACARNTVYSTLTLRFGFQETIWA